MQCCDAFLSSCDRYVVSSVYLCLGGDSDGGAEASLKGLIQRFKVKHLSGRHGRLRRWIFILLANKSHIKMSSASRRAVGPRRICSGSLTSDRLHSTALAPPSGEKTPDGEV